MRRINDEFIKDLSKGGRLSGFLEFVKNDRQKYSLEIRDGYINIYYKGGNLLRITQKKRNGYMFEFDTKYCLNKNDDTNFADLCSLEPYSTDSYLKNLPLLQSEMDNWFIYHRNEERRFQHDLLVNNPCIVDIEYQIANGMRFDMIAVENGCLTIIENKFGTSSIRGKSGIKDHYEKMSETLTDKTARSKPIESVCAVSECKNALGLSSHIIKDSDIRSYKILFILADYNPPKDIFIDEINNITNRSVHTDVLRMTKNEKIIDLSHVETLF